MNKHAAVKYGKKKNAALASVSFAYVKESGVVKISASPKLKKTTKKAASKAARRSHAASNKDYKTSFDVAWKLY